MYIIPLLINLFFLSNKYVIFVLGGTTSERTVFVGGLPWDITTEKLQSHFDSFGRIQKLDLKMNEQTGRPRGFAFIIFSDVEAAKTCLQQSVHTVEGHSVDVKRAIPVSEKKKDGESGGDWYGGGGGDDQNAAQAAQYQQALQQQQQLLMLKKYDTVMFVSYCKILNIFDDERIMSDYHSN
jgi:RNA recognition motif-containing protein